MVKRKGEDYDNSPPITIVSTPEDPTSSCDITPFSTISSTFSPPTSPFSTTSPRTWDETQNAMNKLLEELEGPNAQDNLKTVAVCDTLLQKMENQVEVIRSTSKSLQTQLKNRMEEAMKAYEKEEDVLKEAEDKNTILRERITELRDENEKILKDTKDSKAKTVRYQIESSKQLDQIDEVEAQKKRDVPKQQQYISLFATTTGIKWDYDCVDSLAGEIEIGSKGVHKRFNIDSDDYSSYEIADMLWKMIDT